MTETVRDCVYAVDTATDAHPADRLHWISGLYSYRFIRQDEHSAKLYAEGSGSRRANALADAQALVEVADELMRATVAMLRDEGSSWEQIAASLGITKQAAQQRFGRIKDKR